MRLSLEKDDPGYSDLWRHPDIKIYLDGKQAEVVITADEEKGFVLCWAKGDAFNDNIKEWPKEKLYGKVEIRGFPNE